jgi:hypothetical protein
MNAPQLNALPQRDPIELLSKVIIIEHEESALAVLKDFFEQNQLVGYRATKNTILGVLNSSIDMGAIFLPAHDENGASNLALAVDIHKARPELPIFLRLAPAASPSDIPEEQKRACAGFYADNDRAQLKELIDTYLFSRHYPSEFVTEMKNLTLSAFEATFRDITIEVDPPYIIKDKIIYGELFSLLPLESNWCRGYMMLQSEEKNVLDVIAAHKTSLRPIEATFRHVNTVLGELSNMIWGAFKTRYGAAQNDAAGRIRVEVPIIVNHMRKFVSFGSDDPQLCFKFTLTDPAGKLAPVVMYQKFIFSLDWSPEKFAESVKDTDDMVSSGDLELF